MVATLERIQVKLRKLQAQADAMIAKQSSEVLETIRGLMAKHGLTTADIDAHIGGKKRGPNVRAKAAVTVASATVKYRDPKSGATWSGRGPAPAWIATVKDRTKFLVVGSAAISTTAPATKAQVAGKYVRGPQPAKYMDAKTGATWSGRGPAPAWLASVKDRSRFLIAGAGTVAVAGANASKAKPATKQAVAKSVKTTKVPTVKKTAAKKAVSAETAAPKSASSKKIAGKKAAPTARKIAAKKAQATKAVVAKKVVAKTGVAAAPVGVTAQATA